MVSCRFISVYDELYIQAFPYYYYYYSVLLLSVYVLTFIYIIISLACFAVTISYATKEGLIGLSFL